MQTTVLPQGEGYNDVVSFLPTLKSMVTANPDDKTHTINVNYGISPRALNPASATSLIMTDYDAIQNLLDKWTPGWKISKIQFSLKMKYSHKTRAFSSISRAVVVYRFKRG